MLPCAVVLLQKKMSKDNWDGWAADERKKRVSDWFAIPNRCGDLHPEKLHTTPGKSAGTSVVIETACLAYIFPGS